jgi:hypothetical protein
MCFDKLTQMQLPYMRLIRLQDFEHGDVELIRVKAQRTLLEYYFTCTPSLPLHIFEQNPDVDLMTYLDADLFFYSDPQSVFDEIGTGSIAIIPHRFPMFLRHNEIYGIYNVAWNTFRRDETGLACLNWWRKQCIEWCYTCAEDGRSADQKYLDDWTTRFDNVVVIQNKGADLAPWNLANHTIRLRDGGVYVDDQPLVFFHFHGLKRVNAWAYDPCVEPYGAVLTWQIRNGIFVPYIQTLIQVAREFALILGNSSVVSALSVGKADSERVSWLRSAYRQFKWQMRVLHDMFARKFVFVVNRKVF